MDGNTGFTIEREIHVKKVKRALDNWREIALFVNSVLLWRKNFYPWIIVGVTTYLFVELAYYSPTFLTSLGLAGLLATLVDYGGPSLSAMIWKQEDWSTAKEREFEEICRSLASAIVLIKQTWAYLMELKTTKPYMYFVLLIPTSLFMALIGNSVNNYLFMYIVCLSLLMLPGMLHYGILQKYYNIGLVYVVNLLKTFNGSVTKPKDQ